jgi:hypothetical protein
MKAVRIRARTIIAGLDAADLLDDALRADAARCGVYPDDPDVTTRPLNAICRLIKSAATRFYGISFSETVGNHGRSVAHDLGLLGADPSQNLWSSPTQDDTHDVAKTLIERVSNTDLSYDTREKFWHDLKVLCLLHSDSDPDIDLLNAVITYKSVDDVTPEFCTKTRTILKGN